MKIIIFGLTLILLNSCFCTYEVSVKNNGSAHIKIYDWKEYEGERIEESVGGELLYSNFDKFKNSKIISNYNRKIENKFYVVEYDIENIDSLENYLLPISEDSVKMDNIAVFKFTREKFTITKTYEGLEGPDEVTMYGDLVPFKAIFKFDKRIKKFTSDLDYVKQTDKKTIEINTTLNKISYGKGTFQVEVQF